MKKSRSFSLNRRFLAFHRALAYRNEQSILDGERALRCKPLLYWKVF